MKKIRVIATSTFGLEAIVRREVEALGFTGMTGADGRIEFDAALEDIPRLNLWLRAADRVLIKMAEFPAKDFDQLFDGVGAVPWEEWLTLTGKITVIGKCVRSKLESVRSCQSIVKKAIVGRLQEKFHTEWLEESGQEFVIQISILKDVAQITLDTSGSGLHKRGYRTETGEVPLRENLASALVQLSFWDKDRILIDPMCGSGTILIEAAMIARNIAPGLNREFAAEQWPCIDPAVWREARCKAREAILPAGELKIFGFDIDQDRIDDSRANAKKAGVEKDIVLRRQDIKDLVLDQEYGIIISNPPYGIKLGCVEDVRPLYNMINTILRERKGWSLYILTADKKFPEFFKRSQPDRVRKLFNGTIEVNYYQYYGERPKRQA